MEANVPEDRYLFQTWLMKAHGDGESRQHSDETLMR